MAAIVVLVSFFLPWIGCEGLGARQTLTGAELAKHGAAALWLIPISMLVALLMVLPGIYQSGDPKAIAGTVIGAGVL